MTIEAVEANGISNGCFHNELIGKPIQLLPPVAANGAVAGSQYTWRSSTVATIDRSTTVGLEDGSVASNGGKPNRLEVEVVSFTLKDSFQWNRGRFLAIFQLVIIAYIAVDFTESRRRFELLLVDVGCIYLKRLLYVC